MKNKNKVKYVTKNVVKKIVSMALIVMIVLSNTIYANEVYNFESEDIVAKFSDEVTLGKYRVHSYEYSQRYIKYDGRPQRVYEYYYIDNKNVEHPAYCMNLGKDGAEHISGGYDVNVSSKINDEKVVSILTSGFPYKSVSELGVANDSEARVATQYALWIYLNDLDVNKITKMEKDYERVVNAIQNIYNDGTKSNVSFGIGLKLKKDTKNAIVDNINKGYYSLTYTLEHNENVKKIDILVDGVSDYKITDINNNESVNLISNNKFKVLIPRKSINKDTKINLKLNIEYKQTAILFGAATVSDMQNMALMLNPVSVGSLDSGFDVKYKPFIMKIKKIDYDDNSIVLPNVKFRISSVDSNEVLGEYITNDKGEIVFDVQKDFKIYNEQKVKIEEIEVPSEYYIDYTNNTQIVDLKFDKINEVTFKNKKSKGKIEILKTSLDYNEFLKLDKDSALDGVEFNIYDDKNNLVDTIVTDKNGKAITKDLLLGTYYIKETKPKNYYMLNDNNIRVNISSNGQIVKVDVKNKSKQKELPKTGY